VVLLSRNAAYRRIHDRETADDDGDGVPDIYQP
jgi:Na+:H+ antiporter, NhaA family